MEWKKKGQIFKFNESLLVNRFVSHSQSPQAIIYDEFIRIYFSTRKQDFDNNYFSDVQFVDINRDMNKIINISKNEVITKGNLGCFDEHGIFPFSPLRVGNKIYAYTSGWSRRKSVSVETSIGLAISEDDGLKFNRFGNGSILTSSLKEPFLVVDGFVKKCKGKFYMYYIYGKEWIFDEESQLTERIYKIGMATSNDGIVWTKNERSQIIEDVIGNNECQALPTVIHHKGIYHMYFCYRFATNFRNNSKRGYRLGYAYSDDLINWTRNDSIKGIELGDKGEWDSEMMCYPNLFELDDKIYMLYNGNNFGKDGFGLAELIR